MASAHNVDLCLPDTIHSYNLQYSKQGNTKTTTCETSWLLFVIKHALSNKMPQDVHITIVLD